MMKGKRDFIEYDNHNGVTLLRVCIMNALNKAYYVFDEDIELCYIPYSLLKECLFNGQLEYRWKYDTEWNDERYKIIVRSDLDNVLLFEIYGDVESGRVTINNSTRLFE